MCMTYVTEAEAEAKTLAVAKLPVIVVVSPEPKDNMPPAMRNLVLEQIGAIEDFLDVLNRESPSTVIRVVRGPAGWRAYTRAGFKEEFASLTANGRVYVVYPVSLKEAKAFTRDVVHTRFTKGKSV